MSKVFAFLADGLEEVECLAVVDVLRRAGAEVTLVSVTGSREITGSHHIHFQADAFLMKQQQKKQMYYSSQEVCREPIH